MKRKNLYRFINRKAILVAGLIAFVFCMTFISCDLPDENEITSIKLDKSTLSIPAGDVDYLTVTTVPANATGVIWKTSINGVVTVNNGKITADLSAAGKPVTVIASNASGKVSSSCAVMVTGEPAGTQVSSISLVGSGITMTVNETRTISHSILPDGAANKAVFWTSSAPGVAKVDPSSGIITAVSSGTAEITVTTKNKGKTAKCTVTVSAPSSNPDPSIPSEDAVTSITMTPKTLSLETGKTGTLSVTAAPATATNYTVTWTSSDSAKATVDNNGLVTAVAAGSATITAKVGEFSDTCVVTVTAASSIVLSKTNLTLFTTGGNNISSATITATVPSAVVSGDAVTWVSSDATKATVTKSSTGIGGNITAVAKGTATITVSVTIEGNAKTATCTVTVVDPADYYGSYSGKYKNSSNKEITETVNISRDFIYITDNENTSNPDYFDFTVDKWEPATTPETYKSAYPIALKITGKINNAKPVGASALYGTSTAKDFTQSDITNKTTCWMFVYVSSDGKVIRSPFNKTSTTAGTDNRTAPVMSTTTDPRIYSK